MIETVKCFKYLGVALYKNGNWYRTQKVIAEHSSFALHNLFITFNQIELTAKDKCKLFDKLVGSILNYGAEIFDYHTCKRIENNDSLVKKTYNMLKADTDLGNSYNGLNWTSNIKHILDEIGMSYLWIEHNGLDIKFAPIKQRIIDTCTQDWHSAINNSGRLMTYCKSKVY